MAEQEMLEIPFSMVVVSDTTWEWKVAPDNFRQMWWQAKTPRADWVQAWRQMQKAQRR